MILILWVKKTTPVTIDMLKLSCPKWQGVFVAPPEFGFFDQNSRIEKPKILVINPQGPYIGTTNRCLHILIPFFIGLSFSWASQMLTKFPNMNPSTISCQVKNNQNKTLDQWTKYWLEHLFSNLSITKVEIRVKSTLWPRYMLENKPLATSWHFSNQHAWVETPNGH